MFDQVTMTREGYDDLKRKARLYDLWCEANAAQLPLVFDTSLDTPGDVLYTLENYKGDGQ